MAEMTLTVADRVGAIAVIKPMTPPRTPTAEYLSDGPPTAPAQREEKDLVAGRARADSGAGALSGSLAGSGPADATRQYDDRSALIAALQRLGPRQRAVIVLRYWMDLTEADIAATLDCSVGTVKSQAARALATLRQSAELLDGELQ
jgi:RNA polymerase sigma factor (sigma-70 family)